MKRLIFVLLSFVLGTGLYKPATVKAAAEKETYSANLKQCVIAPVQADVLKHVYAIPNVRDGSIATTATTLKTTVTINTQQPALHQPAFRLCVYWQELHVKSYTTKNQNQLTGFRPIIKSPPNWCSRINFISNT